ncbi:MAG TPA: hypothetical protein VNW97_16360 [Candidatus Saccharimonadales bacterium]|nr:hypothetical protein [Candidatus Saccharimonadales bacterium]
MAGTAAQPLHPEAMTRDAVVEALQDGEMMPGELIKTLSDKKHLPDAAVRIAIWYLISQNELELSSEQKLRLVRAGA